MKSFIKVLAIGLLAVNMHAAGTWSASTFQKNGPVYGFGIPGGINVTSFNSPQDGIAVGVDGKIFVADTSNQVIKELTSITPETAVAGSGTPGTLDGIGIAARFLSPNGLAINPVTQDLFVGSRTDPVPVRRIITPASVMLGSADPIYDVTSLPINTDQKDLVFDSTGTNLYISNYGPNISRYDTVAWGLNATFTAGPSAKSMTFDTGGNLYIASGHGIYRLVAGSVNGSTATLIAGSAGTAGTLDGIGTVALFNDPVGIVVGPDLDAGPTAEALYVTDTSNHTIRKLSTGDGGITWTVSTIAGTAGVTGTNDGTTALFSYPSAIAVGPQGLYINDSANNLIRLLTFTPVPAAPPPPTGPGLSPANTDIQLATSASLAHVTAAAEATFEVNAGGSEGVGGAGGESGEGSVAGGGEGESETFDGTTNNQDVTEFRFGLSPQRLKMDIRAMNNGALANYDKSYGDYGSMLKALETSLGATKAMANVGNGMSFWASGVYAQGRNKTLFGNPAGADKHYGIMVGSHYYHKPTRQLIGMAFDVGLGGSRANTDHKLKSAYRSAEATIYYGYGITKNWKVNLQAAYMLVRANNHRPYGTGNIAIATSRAKSVVTSGSIDTDYKFKPARSMHLKPTVGLRFGHTKQNAYSEKDAGSNSMHFREASMMEVALKTGFKVSLFYKKDDVIIYSLYPEINFTRYLKAGKMRQKAGLVNSGTVQLLESGTPGKNLLSLGLGAGVTNTEDGTKYQVGYTANFQKYRKSQEVMLKGSWQF